MKFLLQNFSLGYGAGRCEQFIAPVADPLECGFDPYVGAVFMDEAKLCGFGAIFRRYAGNYRPDNVAVIGMYVVEVSQLPPLRVGKSKGPLCRWRSV